MHLKKIYMKQFHIFPILFFFVLCTENVIAQQTIGTEEKSTQVTVFRTANPNYVEQIIPDHKVSNERMKNPTVEEPTVQTNNSFVTSEKTKNPVNTEEGK